ncbi:hypothetical protein H7J93_16435 [Mycobacterium barrassiae]|uniref:hypothetical protein n=1 Tax=Mycobacterium barrassiae TaxID=319709 RepID=UPI002265F4BF|nr:hypothetical protein [Mycobacterium barrassiae]MCV7301208.1 hypothetical protein [Mycobacterium barrassiae]
MLGPAPIVPRNFDVPLEVRTEKFTLRPLSWKHFMLDYECYMSSVEHLQQTFDLDGDGLFIDGERWPANSDVEFAFIDASWCQFEWQHLRSSFTYAAFTPAEDKELGCGYIMRSKKRPYLVECQTWVRADMLAERFDQEFHSWFKSWVEQSWPFDPENVGWPGREISWDDWNALPDIEGVTAISSRVPATAHPRSTHSADQ